MNVFLCMDNFHPTSNPFTWTVVKYQSGNDIMVTADPRIAIIIMVWLFWQQGKYEGFDSSDRPSNWSEIVDFFRPCDLEILQMTLKNNRAPLLYHVSFVHYFKAIGKFKVELQSGNAQYGPKSVIFLSRVTLNLIEDLGNQ